MGERQKKKREKKTLDKAELSTSGFLLHAQTHAKAHETAKTARDKKKIKIKIKKKKKRKRFKKKKAKS